MSSRVLTLMAGEFTKYPPATKPGLSSKQMFWKGICRVPGKPFDLENFGALGIRVATVIQKGQICIGVATPIQKWQE